ncbi:hypothetical protein PRVXH_001843 [Proteinivorax hydrogeniformans]|uniref:Uncharacterized protein n=1 Tax=Proteinivorax hydrogeniformans TaxID=1826727 RepID=A0AAU8HSE9_9FIRM
MEWVLLIFIVGAYFMWKAGRYGSKKRKAHPPQSKKKQNMTELDELLDNPDTFFKNQNKNKR